MQLFKFQVKQMKIEEFRNPTEVVDLWSKLAFWPWPCVEKKSFVKSAVWATNKLASIHKRCLMKRVGCCAVILTKFQLPSWLRASAAPCDWVATCIQELSSAMEMLATTMAALMCLPAKGGCLSNNTCIIRITGILEYRDSLPFPHSFPLPVHFHAVKFSPLY